MKKIFLAAMAAVALCACSTTEQPVPAADGNTVTITFTKELNTRAFLDDTAVAEPWESAINSMAIYCFNAAGERISNVNLLSSQISDGRITLRLPRSVEGTTCSFFAVANSDPGLFLTRSELEEKIETTTIYEYNGTFDAVTSGTVRGAGFVMSGYTEVIIKPVTNVAITLKRTVAKVALRTKVSDEFNDLYKGTVEINKATIWSQPQITSLFETNGYATDSGSNTSFVQEVYEGDGYCNLFYFYERPAATNNNYQYITLNGTYSGENGLSRPVQYDIKIEGSGNGQIKRNGYYRLDCTIKGTGNSEVDLTFTVADWETPTTETIELGI